MTERRRRARWASRRVKLPHLVAIAAVVVGGVVLRLSRLDEPRPVPSVPPVTTSEPSWVPLAHAFGCAQDALGNRGLVQSSGALPTCEQGWWVFALPAQQGSHNTVRRAEIVPTTRHGAEVYSEGETYHLDGVVVAELGVDGRDEREWHVVWQLHGPANGEWRDPIVSLVVRGGELLLVGGGGHPREKAAGDRSYQWFRPLAVYTDGKPYHFRLDVHLSSDPERGWIDVRLDDQRILERWHPESSDGLRPGTLYPGQLWVENRIGLYRGSDSTTAADRAQTVRWRLG